MKIKANKKTIWKAANYWWVPVLCILMAAVGWFIRDYIEQSRKPAWVVGQFTPPIGEVSVLIDRGEGGQCKTHPELGTYRIENIERGTHTIDYIRTGYKTKSEIIKIKGGREYWAIPPSLAELSFTEIKSNAKPVPINLEFKSLNCLDANDPGGEDEIFFEIIGSLPDGNRYQHRSKVYKKVCSKSSAVPIPFKIWDGLVMPAKRAAFDVFIKEVDKTSGPEDILSVRIETTVLENGKLLADIKGLSIYEDNQNNFIKLGDTQVINKNDQTRSATISTNHKRSPGTNRVAYSASISW